MNDKLSQNPLWLSRIVEMYRMILCFY